MESFSRSKVILKDKFYAYKFYNLNDKFYVFQNLKVLVFITSLYNKQHFCVSCHLIL